MSDKPRPNGPQGGSKNHAKFPLTKGGTPRDTPPPSSKNACHPMKSPGSGTHGSGNKATPPSR